MAESPPLPFALRAYAGVATALSPLVGLYARRRLARGKEDPERIGERRGVAGLPRPPGPLAWLHGASVGEFLSIVPLIRDLQGRGITVLVTTVSRTSATIAAARLPEGAIHQFMPWDVPAYTRRFLDHWQPDIAIFAESELWPNLLVNTTARGTPVIQVNGRLSERSFARWRKAPAVARALLSRFELCLVQTVEDARRVAALGAPRVETTGNLKFDVPAPEADPVALDALRFSLMGRPTVLAASTHEGEDEQVIAAHRLVREREERLLTIIAPRHPERGDAIAALARQAGLAVEQRSKGGRPGLATDLYVADTMGEMGLFYRLASVAFVGGSLVPHGGQNPIEPAKLDVPVVAGPHTHSFTAIYDALEASGGMARVGHADDLAQALRDLLADPALRAVRIAAAHGVVQTLGGALGRTQAALAPYILDLKLKGRG